ncbi:MAG: glycosyltransferase family 2 protein [Bacteroidota bacterium]
MSSPVKISTVIITLNEEANIQRCIDSVKDIVDEIVVVDSFSSDRTPEICKENQVTFIQHKFEGYVEQINYALTQATHNHVLSLDADESLSEAARKKVRAVKENWEYDGYQFNRLTNYCGKWIRHCGWYPDKKVRLFDRTKAQWGGENPHYRVMLEKEQIKYLNVDMLHYSFPSITSHAQTANNFSTIAANEAIKKGKKASFLVHVLLNPPFTFFKKYFFQLGFLDGFYGWVVCVLSAYSNFLKYVKIWSYQKYSRF